MKKIAIHSVPRSGSTWLGEIFNSHPDVIYKYQPLFSYAFKSRVNENSTKKEIADFFSAISNAEDSFLDQTEARDKGSLPNFIKSNIPKAIVYKEVRYHHILKNILEQDSEIKVIGLVRNPFAVINSWLNAPKEFRKELGWEELEEWRFADKKNLNKIEEFNGFERWKEVCYLFFYLLKKHPQRFYLINYSDLIIDPELEVHKAFDFCELEYTRQTESFLHASKTKQSEDAYTVFKQKKDDLGWQKTLPYSIEAEIRNDPEFIEINKTFKWI